MQQRMAGTGLSRNGRGVIETAVLALTALLLLACTENAAKSTPTPPAKTEAIEGSTLKKVTLIESAAKRIALETGVLAEEAFGLRGEPGPRKIVPFSALIYDLNGGTWVYTSPAPLTFVRQPVTIDYVQLDKVVLHEGPSAGTAIVVRGTTEIYGVETGVK